MASSNNAIDWDRLKPRILQDLANGKTQKQIREGLAQDPDDILRVSISKSQLETQLKHWKYRHSLHEPEWKVVSHRIKKRWKMGKPTSQLLVNGFVFSEKKIAKAIKRYDTPTLVLRLPSPQIPPELSHHSIEVRTPPSSYQSLQPQPSKANVATTERKSFALRLKLAGRVWPQTPQWRRVELLVAQFVARFFIPTYEQDEWFREAFNTLRREFPKSRTYRNENALASHPGHEKFVPDHIWYPRPDVHDSVSVHRDEISRSSGQSYIHTAVVKTLLGLLYGFSNQSLTNLDRQILASIIEAPAWDTVFPHLRDVLTMIDSNIVQAIAEGLFKESIRTFHQRMLDLSLSLGMDSAKRIRCFVSHDPSTPLAALCKLYIDNSSQKQRRPIPEGLILSLLKRDPHLSNSNLLWTIRASCHAIAEGVIRNEPKRAVDFAIPVSELEGDSWFSFDRVTPLLVACSDLRQSAEKLSLVRCLLERGAKPGLKAMIAAAGACDGEVISLLHQHGAPVNGFIPQLGSPLSSACKVSLLSGHHYCTDLTAIPLLLRLGASPNNPENRDLNSCELSPLHILALAEERATLTEALDLLLEYGADINHRARLYELRCFDDRVEACETDPDERLARTALEYAIESSRWKTAIQLLSANCELTGREILLIGPELHGGTVIPEQLEQERFRQFIGALLDKAPRQAAARDWRGLTVLQRAIQNEHEDMILALFAVGVTPAPSDFLCIICNKEEICRLSSSIQMKLLLAARSIEPPMAKVFTVRLILAYACPGVVRHVLNSCPDVYDSEGLCYLVARVVSKDKLCYFHTFYWVWGEEYQQEDSLTVDDLHTFVSRRTISNSHEDWENTAVNMAARAGRADILRMVIGSGQEVMLRRDGFIPLFLLKEVLVCGHYMIQASDIIDDEDNFGYLGVWIKYCRMDNPNMRCAALTAAAMVVPETAAEEVVNLLLALNYQPDGWTVLIASCRGYTSILQHLERLKSWPHIMSHKDRPDWCPTALQIAVYNSHVGTVEFLLDRGPTIDAMDLCPSRPAYFVSQSADTVDELYTLLPRTALQHAVDQEDMGLVTLLVDAGANVNAPAAMDSGATSLQIASIRGSILMVQYLISQGADVDAEGAAKNGRMALHGAAEHGHKDVVELLLAHGASASYSYHEQLVEAIFYAEKNAQHVVARILRERLLPQWSSDVEDTLEMLEEEWESSSDYSVFFELRDELEAWRETFEDSPELLRAYESNPNSCARNEEPRNENPAALQEDDSWFTHEMEWGVEGHGGLDFHRNSESDFYDGDVVSRLTFREDDTACTDFLQSFEGYGVDEMLLGFDFES